MASTRVILVGLTVILALGIVAPTASAGPPGDPPINPYKCENELSCLVLRALHHPVCLVDEKVHDIGPYC